MYIFIDESGIFSNPNNKEFSISCLGALIVPQIRYNSLVKSFSSLIKRWFPNGEEPKGSKLMEYQFEEMIELLFQHSVIFEPVIYDAGLNSADEVKIDRTQRIGSIRKSVDERHSLELRTEIANFCERADKLSLQLYVQMILLSSLVLKSVEMGTLYYCQRMSRELGEFKWAIDAKNDLLTEYENLWSELVYPLVQSISMATPMMSLKGGDYRFYQKFQYEKSQGVQFEDKRESASNVKKLMSDLKFVDSKSECGILMADIVTTGLRRCLVGNIAPTIAKQIGRLIVIRKDGLKVARLSGRENQEEKSKQVPYGKIIREINSVGRSLFPKDR